MEIISLDGVTPLIFQRAIVSALFHLVYFLLDIFFAISPFWI